MHFYCKKNIKKEYFFAQKTLHCANGSKFFLKKFA